MFFVHNRIETIVAHADHVRRIVPRARIAVAHGQMRERELEDIMHRFVSGEIDVLVSTLIVESGLDVPNANTMFVNRADHLGLAQLYQLRGRVGRSHRRAYCYLLVPDSVDPDAERRLQVLEHHTELGAGYKIALKDMEMRGAGNLLGAEQSGYVHAVGFDLYLRMLDETVQRLMRGDARAASRSPPTSRWTSRPTCPTTTSSRRRPSSTCTSASRASRRRRRSRRCAPSCATASARCRAPAEAMLAMALLRVVGGTLGIEGILVRGEEARITFRDSAIPRMKGLSAAFHEVQFQAEVRRAHPLSLKLTRLGGAQLLDGLVRALRAVV